MSEPPHGDLLPDADRLATSLASMVAGTLRLPRDRRVVIAVAGESGSGKSTTATRLGRALSNAGVRAGLIHQDDYFLRPPRTNHEYRLLDLAHVGPHEVNLDLLQTHLDAFLEANLMGSLRLIQSAHGAGVARFIFISTCAVHEVILEDRPLDETFCRDTEQRLWQAGRAATEWTNMALQPPPAHVMELFAAAVQNKALADELTDNFNAPERNRKIFGDPESASAFLTRHASA